MTNFSILDFFSVWSPDSSLSWATEQEAWDATVCSQTPVIGYWSLGSSHPDGCRNIDDSFLVMFED